MLLSIVAISATSCKKAMQNRSSMTSSDDSDKAEQVFSGVYSTAVTEVASDELTRGNNRMAGVDSTSCKTVTVEHDSTTGIRTRTVDFGDGCVGLDGKTRSGKIIIVMNGRRIEAGSSFTVTFDNYYVDDYKVEGTKTVANGGLDANGNYHFTISVVGAKITDTDGNVISWDANRTRILVEGYDTPLNLSDDVYEITGSSSGINREGLSFTRTITTALRYEVSCRYVSQGVVEIEPEGLDKRILDYGDGTCDTEATLTIGNREKTIDLSKRRWRKR